LLIQFVFMGIPDLIFYFKYRNYNKLLIKFKLNIDYEIKYRMKP
jgi:hypothetical protein